jgi:hypothetical protein
MPWIPASNLHRCKKKTPRIFRGVFFVWHLAQFHRAIERAYAQVSITSTKEDYQLGAVGGAAGGPEPWLNEKRRVGRPCSYQIHAQSRQPLR